MHRLRLAAALSAALPVAFVSHAVIAQDAQDGHGRPEPPMLGIHWAKGFAPASKQSKSPDMLFHGGTVMPAANVTTIFWGPGWADPTFYVDKFTGLDDFYGGLNKSSYAVTSDEYSGTNGAVTPSIAMLSSYVDTSALFKASAPQTSDILNEVCKVLAATNNAPDPAGYYAVYVDKPRGHAGYCAWHSWGACGGTPIQFAFFFNLDGDPGCDPQASGTGHSQGLDALANVSGHEISEARTDPRGDGWYDSGGAENADKCAWAFGTDLLTLSNRTKWKIQGNWSNAHYDTSSGYPNRSGQLGCIDGGNFK